MHTDRVVLDEESCLVDLSDFIPVDFAPGRYQAVVRLHASSSAPFEPVLRAPTEVSWQLDLLEKVGSKIDFARKTTYPEP